MIMKKQLLFALGMIVAICAVSIVPSQAAPYNTIRPIEAGDQFYWKVLNFNETATWWGLDFPYQSYYYRLNIGEKIIFTVSDVDNCYGYLKIGNLTVLTERSEIGFNLMLITGPAWPPTWNYSFDPALISPTNWQYQIELANNATDERSGASIIIGESYKTFLGLNRSVISFNFTSGEQTSNAIYDNETGVLLYIDCRHMSYWLEMILAYPDEIPGFEIALATIIMSGFLILVYYKRRRQLIHPITV